MGYGISGHSPLVDSGVWTGSEGIGSLPFRERRVTPGRGREEIRPQPHRVSDARAILTEAVSRLGVPQALSQLSLLERDPEVMGEVRVGLRHGTLSVTDLRTMVLRRLDGVMDPLRPENKRSVMRH